MKVSGLRFQEEQMVFSIGLSSILSGYSDAAGIAGNLFAFVLFVSPIPTFQRIIRNQSTEQFSGLPYVYTLLNCLITSWYGMPFVSPNVILVATVNSIGAAFQSVYIIIFIIFAEKEKKLKMLGSAFLVFTMFMLIAFVSMRFFNSHSRQLLVGCLSVLSLIFMFASPLFIINLVIKTKSVEYMPFYLSLSTFLMSLSFFTYGLSKMDLFIYIPNGIGTILGVIQLMLYYYYSSKYGKDSSEPLVARKV